MQQTNQTILTPSRDSSGAVLAALKAAFPQTIPVLTGYFVLGLGYGIYVQSLGLTMLERYQGYGPRGFYMIYAMSDETFSITCSAEPPEGVDRG